MFWELTKTHSHTVGSLTLDSFDVCDSRNVQMGRVVWTSGGPQVILCLRGLKLNDIKLIFCLKLSLTEL